MSFVALKIILFSEIVYVDVIGNGWGWYLVLDEVDNWIVNRIQLFLDNLSLGLIILKSSKLILPMELSLVPIMVREPAAFILLNNNNPIVPNFELGDLHNKGRGRLFLQQFLLFLRLLLILVTLIVIIVKIGVH